MRDRRRAAILRWTGVIVFLVYCLFRTPGMADAAAQGMIPSAIVSMDTKGSTAIVVEKSTQTLYLYRYDGTYKEEFRLKCSTGKLDGRKSRSGDQKTPEGVYFFVGKYLKKDLSPIYGIMALPTDYPNPVDVLDGRTGNAIWLHGTNKALKPMDSNGCVALEDRNVELLEKRISLDHTPIIINETIHKTFPAENTGITSKIDTFLSAWQSSMAKGTYHEYLEHYLPEYAPDISWWNRWRLLRRESPGLSIAMNRRSIFKNDGVYVVLLEEILKTGNHDKVSGIRKVYLKDKNGHLKITGDEYKKIHSLDEVRPEKTDTESPLLAAGVFLADSVKREKSAGTMKTVKSMILEWAKAWASGDIDAYGSCYSDGFVASGMNKNAWLDRKRYLSKTYNYIDVQISEPVIELGDETVTVSFRQDYKSSGYSAVGHKTLVLVNEEKQWKIIQEIWKKN